MSSNFDPYTFLNSIRAILGLPPATTPVIPYTPLTPVPSLPPAPQSFPVVNQSQIDDLIDQAPKPKIIPFSGLPGYSERGAPDDWDTALGEVYGYRWWYVIVLPEMVGYLKTGSRNFASARRLGVLYGANNQPWADGRIEARCTRAPSLFTMSKPGFTHQPPETREACGCGFWAYFNKGLRVDEVLANDMAGSVPYLYSYGAGIPVFGVVKGTGRVIIGEKGFRSQYAQIMGLCIPQVAVNQLQWWITGQVEGYYVPHIPAHEPCSEAEHLTRISEMESILAMGYPSAKIFSSQGLLTQYFPPDANYA